MLGIQNLYEQRNIELTHQLNAALKAWNLFHRDQQYIVKDGEVIIVDEFTGRLMYGRRYSDGIHQAIEAKEGIKVRGEDQTLATITFQNLFRLYEHLAGMTGTAKTEEREFRDIYGLDVVVVPTNMPMVRKDNSDIVYKSEKAKFDAVVDEIIAEHQKGRPVLVGTRSIEKSELLATMLRRKGVECNVLNAKYHEQEAEIIKDAGQDGQVTIATNMAGRGTDIKLGEGVARNGGLHIIGTERHESRRIDNQLRGRSGRQGDPGSSRFYVSLEDEVMRLFGGERMTNDHGARRLHRRAADRVGTGDEVDPARAGQGREPQLRDPQARARVRRRDEQAALGHLRRSARDSGREVRFADVHAADARGQGRRGRRGKRAGERAPAASGISTRCSTRSS